MPKTTRVFFMAHLRSVKLFTVGTFPRTNIFAPENGCLDDSFPFGMASWHVRTVSFRECKAPTKIRG